MTNFEKYKDEILEISRTQPIAINKRRNVPEECSYNVCSECLLHEGTYCNQKAIFQWLYSEYQEPAPKLTKCVKGTATWRSRAGTMYSMFLKSISLTKNLKNFQNLRKIVENFMIIYLGQRQLLFISPHYNKKKLEVEK